MLPTSIIALVSARYEKGPTSEVELCAIISEFHASTTHEVTMADRRGARGPHPKDEDCFDDDQLLRLRRGVADLSWLRSRGYSSKAALDLVGNRYALRDRQRIALQRCAAGDEECRQREMRRVADSALEGATLVVDGYNVLLTLEAALSGGVLLRARDGAFRDLAAMSAHYRRLRVTRPAIGLVRDHLERRGCERVLWYLDSPVSNSGRLKGIIEAAVAGSKAAWEVRLIKQVDRAVATSPHIVATADSAILDRCSRWFNLARSIVEQSVPEAWIVDLGGVSGRRDCS